ncbi:MAG: PD-(D/E)XK nuclease family protein [Verrucomicrobia bacterium]|nr:PD-(D/E)XK nuclease family protein [Verrucomicrobiota bacterium]
MDVTFLLGPAGSGKTHRCLADVRAALRAEPDGPPILFLAPKQATFQIERQLLADGALAGWTRLHILSFERLAQWILDALDFPQPEWLDEEGRLMVLRAILAQRHGELKIFHATARLPGFARQLSLLLRELQRHQLTPARLLAFRANCSSTLAVKLDDLAALLRAYNDWLAARNLRDADSLPDLATAALREAASASFRIPQLWLDGFAEMTPQELDLLAALAPFCDRATLAFCLEAEPREDPSWLSPWSIVGRTFLRCREHFAAQRNSEIHVEVLPRRAETSRFTNAPALVHLEEHWNHPARCISTDDERAAQFLLTRPSATLSPSDGERAGVRGNPSGSTLPLDESPIRAFQCADPEAEAVLAAREILRHVQGGGRFRDCAVLVRSLDAHHVPLRRVFTRYDIPFFLDRRESAAHHPLAELTRAALRVVAFNWRHDDWFAALKTGLAGASDDAVDRLENLALARGLQGDQWLTPIQIDADESQTNFSEECRQKLTPPFLHLRSALGEKPTGLQLAAAIRTFWNELKIADTLEEWTRVVVDSALRTPHSALHSTVWRQLQTWLENIERAFADAASARTLREWLPILEAGLGGLTVGVVPPALDQVLVGAVDRSRNPDLELAIVLGLNEGVFPAPPAASPLLTEPERDELDTLDRRLAFSPRPRHGHERYLGYIACTRPRCRLVLTCAQRDVNGGELNPSPLLAHIQRLFPSLNIEAAPDANWPDALHPCEVMAPLISGAQAARLRAEHADASVGLESGTPATTEIRVGGPPALQSLRDLACFREPLAKAAQLRALGSETLSSAAVEKLFGRNLDTSVSALEDYAECPFRFLAARGLKAQEREEFTVDASRTGTFMHEAMKEFHQRTKVLGKKWSDWQPAEAAKEIERIGTALLVGFSHKLFEQSAAARFTGRVQIEQLQRLVAVLVAWARQNKFEPREVEVSFGMGEKQLLPWELALAGGHALRLHGRVDRVDVCRDATTGDAWAIVLDYKSSARALDALRVANGLELQLLAYLGALAALGDPEPLFGAKKLHPAGVFYVPLRGVRLGGSGSRSEVLANRDAAQREAYQHTGRFDAEAIPWLDTRGEEKGEQFKFKFNKDETLSKSGNDALASGEFKKLLNSVQAKLVEFGDAIFAGQFPVAPYRKGSETACDWCKFKPVCRFDPWTQPYRALKKPAQTHARQDA